LLRKSELLALDAPVFAMVFKLKTAFIKRKQLLF